MSADKKYRYPGIASFETSDTDIFFGREEDRIALADRVEAEKNLLLYSRSGLGKSSLLKAALIPELQQRGYKPYYIRLGLYQEGSLPPVQAVLRKTVLSGQTQLPQTFLKKFLNSSVTLWHAFKSLQVSDGDTSRAVVLIFDQFEELASYPERYVVDFKKQLAELLFTSIPKEYGEALKDDNLLEEPLSDAELDLLYKPLRIKVLFSIRSDQLSVINNLSDYLPNILKTYYELKPLSKEFARAAIVKPAAMQSDTFRTGPFTYQEAALGKITDSLASKRTEDIDTAQLQILLQYVERDIVEKTGDTDIEPGDLGDLARVYENYYLNSLRKLKDSQQQEARMLIEDNLISEGQRISLDVNSCLKVTDLETLRDLVDIRLLRAEPNTMGRLSYEVSHDSLVAPILKTREERKQIEEKHELERQLIEVRRKQRQRQITMAIVLVALVASIGSGSFGWYYRGEAVEQRKMSDSLARAAVHSRDSIDRVRVDLNSAMQRTDETLKQLTAANEQTQNALIATDSARRASYLSEQKAKAEKKRVVAEQAKTIDALKKANRAEKLRLLTERKQLEADARVYVKSGDSILVHFTNERIVKISDQISSLDKEQK